VSSQPSVLLILTDQQRYPPSHESQELGEWQSFTLSRSTETSYVFGPGCQERLGSRSLSLLVPGKDSLAPIQGRWWERGRLGSAGPGVRRLCGREGWACAD
jgi:hypothetical protein